MNDNEIFDKQFGRMQIAMAVIGVVSIASFLGGLLFLGWVAVKLLQFYGVI